MFNMKINPNKSFVIIRHLKVAEFAATVFTMGLIRFESVKMQKSL